MQSSFLDTTWGLQPPPSIPHSDLLNTGCATKSHELPREQQGACVPVLWGLPEKPHGKPQENGHFLENHQLERLFQQQLPFCPFSLPTLPSLFSAGTSFSIRHISTDGAQEFCVAARSLWVAETCDPSHPMVTSGPALVAVCFVQEYIRILSALGVLKTTGGGFQRN